MAIIYLNSLYLAYPHSEFIYNVAVNSLWFFHSLFQYYLAKVWNGGKNHTKHNCLSSLAFFPLHSLDAVSVFRFILLNIFQLRFPFLLFYCYFILFYFCFNYHFYLYYQTMAAVFACNAGITLNIIKVK